MMKIQTVTGTIAPEELGITDGHNHLWITKQALPAADAPVLDQPDKILAELHLFRQAGGNSQIDCQPVYAGRDGNKLRWLADNSGVQVVGNTGFHLRRYYPEDAPLWELDAGHAAALFIDEIKYGLQETLERPEGVVFPGFIKIAVEKSLAESPRHLIEAAVQASLETGYLIEMHTERGQDIDSIAGFITGLGLAPEKLVICHMDKRPDHVLHQALAQEGFGLEYDTFFREKYRPEENLWPLIEAIVTAGYAKNLVLATDLADASLWAFRGGIGITSFVKVIKTRLEAAGYEENDIQAMMGGTIARRLAIANKE
jgi:phosphotriesterase-related protein